jgi:hypothetical protein
LVQKRFIQMSIDIKLQSIYKSLVEGDFVTKLDAFSLAGVGLDGVLGSEAEPPSAGGAGADSPRGPVVLAGLRRLTEEIERLLISAGIHEQSLMLRISKDLLECEGAVQGNAVHKSMQPQQQDGDREAAAGAALVPDWKRLPKADDHYELQALDEEGRRVRLAGLRSRIQDLHAEITSQVGTKCYVYKKVHGIYETYLSRLTELALNSGVRHAAVRAKMVVDTHMSDVLSNKFLCVDALKIAKQQTVRMLADLSFYGGGEGEGVEYADHQLAFKSVLQLHARKAHFLDFGVSFRVGCVCVLLLWAAFEVLVNELHGKETWLDPSFTIFICIGMFLALLWCWGCSMYIWRNAGIDFIRVLNLENTSLATVRRPEDLVLRSATDLTLVYLIVFIAFNSAKTRVFSSTANPWIAHSLPVALLLFFLYRVFVPWQADRRLWFSMVTSMSRPLLGRPNRVSFRDGYVADILTSLVRVYLSIFFAFSYTIGLAYFAFSSEPDAVSTVHLSQMDQAVRNNPYFRNILLPIITLLPLKIRLVQCLLRVVETGNRWPHFGNALKYATCAIVVAQGLFDREVQHQVWWLVCLFLVTMYQFVWDIFMDWGLVTLSRADGSLRMRSNRYIGPNWVYYVAIGVNFVLRFAWILTLIQLDVTNTEKDAGERKDKYIFVFDYLHPVAAGLEILRRMMWGIFRVEFEEGEASAAEAGTSIGYSGQEPAKPLDPPAASFEKLELSSMAMADGEAPSRYGRGGVSLSDGFVEYITYLVYEWVEFFMSFFGLCASNSGAEEVGAHNRSDETRKQRITESVIFALVLAFLLSISIFI